jgi:hypothetical protein
LSATPIKNGVTMSTAGRGRNIALLLGGQSLKDNTISGNKHIPYPRVGTANANRIVDL